MRKPAIAALLVIAATLLPLDGRAEVAMSAFEYRHLFEDIDDALIRKQYASAREQLGQLTPNSGTEFEITLRQLAAAIGMHKEAEADRYADKLQTLTADMNQALRGNLLLANNNLFRAMMLGLENEPWKSYCRKSPEPCDENDLMYADRAIRRFVVLGQPDGEKWAPRLIKQLAAEEEKNRQAARDAEAARAAQAKADADARERKRQQEIAEQEAARERARKAEAERNRLAAEAAARERQEAAWRADLPQRHTFAYQASFIGASLLQSLLILKDEARWWIFPLALIAACLLHRHLVLRVAAATLCFVWLAVLVGTYADGVALGAVLKFVTVKAIPDTFASYPSYLEARGTDADTAQMAFALVTIYPALSLLLYAVALLTVGTDTRRVEWRRWRTAFDMPMLLADRLTHWRQERRFRLANLPQPALAAGPAPAHGGYRSRIPLGEYGKFGFWLARTTLMLFLFWTVWSAGGELWRGLLQALPAIFREPIAAGADWVSKQVRQAPTEPAVPSFDADR